mmetsp:Transcript_6705/g.17288  ORF Transcript_6705/g.17288 Transcript_6705/m.17288 type:complete len:238 (+) Transcript_6705:3092-3805(+)
MSSRFEYTSCCTAATLNSAKPLAFATEVCDSMAMVSMTAPTFAASCKSSVLHRSFSAIPSETHPSRNAATFASCWKFFSGHSANVGIVLGAMVLTAWHNAVPSLRKRIRSRQVGSVSPSSTSGSTPTSVNHRAASFQSSGTVEAIESGDPTGALADAIGYTSTPPSPSSPSSPSPPSAAGAAAAGCGSGSGSGSGAAAPGGAVGAGVSTGRSTGASTSGCASGSAAAAAAASAVGMG